MKLKSQLNISEEFGMCLWCCWKDLENQDFNEIYFHKIWTQDAGDIEI